MSIASLARLDPLHDGAAPAAAAGVGVVAAGDAGRNAGLDLARAAAITMVFASHTLTGFVSPQVVTALQWGGKAGVELFFSLSGFLIGSILIRMAQTELGPRSVGAFLFRRWMRTLPAYFVALGFMSWFFSSFNIHHWLLLQNFHLKEPRLLVVSWSLVIEEYFYFFFPLTMLLLAGIVGRGHRLVATVAWGLIVVCAGGALAAEYKLITVDTDVLHENPFIRMDCAAYGVIAATLLHGSPGLIRWVSARAVAILATTFVVIATWMMLFVAVSHVPGVTLVGWGFRTWGPPYFALQSTVLDLVFAIVVLALYLRPPRMPAWLGSAVRAIALWSYSIYLFHVIVITVVPYYAPAIGPGVGRLAVVTLGTLVVAALGYHLIERPFLVIRDRLVPSRSVFQR